MNILCAEMPTEVWDEISQVPHLKVLLGVDVLHDDAQYLEWAMNENIISVSDKIKDMIYDCLTY